MTSFKKQKKGDFMAIRERRGKKGITYQVYIRYKDKFGVDRSYSKSGFLKKREAIRHENEILIKIEKEDVLLKKPNLTFNEVFYEYMKIVGVKKYAVSTACTYYSKFHTHIENSIGKFLISQIKYKDIQMFFNKLGNNSKALNLDIKKIFSVTFQYAIKNEYVDKNPVSLIEVTGKESIVKKQVLSLEEINQLVDLLTEENTNRDMFVYYAYCIALYIGVYLGTRISETLALEKDDFDFIENTVQINKRLESRDKEKGLYVTHKLKTSSSKATLPVCKPLKEILVRWFEYNDNDLVCCKRNGDYIRYESLNRAINKEAIKLGFHFNSHMLRHSYSTHLISNNVPIKIASELARHSDVSTTLNVYVHPSSVEKEEAISKTFNKN